MNKHVSFGKIGEAEADLAAPRQATTAESRTGLLGRLRSRGSKTQLLLVSAAALILSIAIDQWLADWTQMRIPVMTYRRIGPTEGPQVFIAGSSDLQFALSWSEVSKTLGEGMENWGSAGTTPTEWEMSQAWAKNTNLMILGLSIYNLNENTLCDYKPKVVPITRTIHDLWQSEPGWQFSAQSLSQYPMAYIQELFPTAGRSEAFLVAARRKFRLLTGRPLSGFDTNFLVLRNQPILDFGDSTERVSDWPKDKLLRRLDAVRATTGNACSFDGPKKLALQRMLERAQQRGRIIIVVLPLSRAYRQAFVTPDVVRAFEASLQQARKSAPDAEFIRLDKVARLSSDDYFMDFVHLNTAGRQIATNAFVSWLNQRYLGQLSSFQ
jgi:hypothetical protein